MADADCYGKVNDDILSALAGIVGEKNVLTGDDRENYSRDETPDLAPALPEVIVKPADTAAEPG